MRKLNRRDLLKLGIGATAAELASLGLHGCGGRSMTTSSVPTTPGASCSKLSDIECVAILIQENRSFDHYFGSYRGVRGFSDPSMAYQQPNPANTTSAPIGTLLPFHLDTATTNAACTHDIADDWVLHAGGHSLLLRARRRLYDLRQLFLLGDRADRSKSPIHHGGFDRS